MVGARSGSGEASVGLVVRRHLDNVVVVVCGSGYC